MLYLIACGVPKQRIRHCQCDGKTIHPEISGGWEEKYAYEGTHQIR